MNQLQDKPHVQHNKLTWLGRTVNPNFSQKPKTFSLKRTQKGQVPESCKASFEFNTSHIFNAFFGSI